MCTAYLQRHSVLQATHGAEQHLAVLLQIAAAGLEKRQAAVHLLDDAVGNDIVFMVHNEEHFAVARICAVQNCIDDFCRYKNDDTRVHGAFNALIYDSGKQHDAGRIHDGSVQRYHDDRGRHREDLQRDGRTGRQCQSDAGVFQ